VSVLHKSTCLMARPRYKAPWRKPRPMAGHDKERAGSAFPPLSTSLLIGEDGSDRDFRRLVYGLINLGQLIIRHREYYGAYLGVTGRQYVIMAILSLAGSA